RSRVPKCFRASRTCSTFPCCRVAVHVAVPRACRIPRATEFPRLTRSGPRRAMRAMDRRDRRPSAIFLMGPTASGKTALACRLAERFPCALVSVDSALVYRGLDIGSAKPDPDVLARFPHRLIDIRDPHQPYSAADFRADAIDAMAAIGREGRVPLLVGGTGLYFRALEHGLSPLPPADADLRARLQADAARVGWRAMPGRLAEFDPDAALRIRSGEAQRILRALEVWELTGQPLSRQQQASHERP